MEKTKKAPDLRFDGFEGDICSHNFTDIAKKRKLINSNLAEKNLLSLSYGKIKRKDINSKKGLLPSSFSSYQIIDEGTIVFRFTDLQNDQKSLRVGLSKEKGIVSSAYVCVDPDTNLFEKDYLYWLLHHEDTQKVFYKMGDGIRQTITYADLKEYNISSPLKEEQRCIANLCNQIDNKIIQHEILCEKLRNIKKALLTSLFPQGNNRQPKIRLKGFSRDWEEHLLSEFAFRIKRKNENLESENIMTISASYGLISQSEFYNKRIASADLSGYYLMRKGEFAYNKSYSSEYPWGAVKRLDNYNEGVVSNLYIIFGVQNISSDFLSSYFMTGLWYNEVAMCAKEGARNHGLLNISADDFLAIRILIPGSLEEQQAIADLLLQYDRLIQLNDQKLEHLKNLKKALLDKMFV